LHLTIRESRFRLNSMNPHSRFVLFLTLLSTAVYAQSQLSVSPSPIALSGTNLNIQVSVTGSGAFTIAQSGAFFSVSENSDTAPATFIVSVSNTSCSNGGVTCNGSITIHPTGSGGGSDVVVPVTFTPGFGNGGGGGGSTLTANPSSVSLTTFANQSVATTVTLTTNSVTPIVFSLSVAPANSWLTASAASFQVSASGTSPGAATINIYANATGLTSAQQGTVTVTPSTGSALQIPVSLSITGSSGSTYTVSPTQAAFAYPGSATSMQVTITSTNASVSTYNASVQNCSGPAFVLVGGTNATGTQIYGQPVSGGMGLVLFNPQSIPTGLYTCQVIVSNPSNGSDQVVIPVSLTVNGGSSGCVQPLCVNRTDDLAGAPVSGMLRYAVMTAAPGATITFDPALNSQTIHLDTSSPNNHIKISQDLTIAGPGPVTISGGNSTRIFFIAGGNVTISGVTLANGYAKGGDGAAGGNGGGGAAGMGGAIFLSGGFLTLNSVVFSNNRATGGNGGANGSQGLSSGGGGGFGGSANGLNGGPGGDLVNSSGGAGGGLNNFGPAPGGNGGFGGGGGGGSVSCNPADGPGGIGGFGGGGGAGGGTTSAGGFGGGAGAILGGNANCTTPTGGGGGGAGMGGAIFASSGSLLATNVTFLSNSTVGGVGGSQAQGGAAKGGSLFICSSSFCGVGHDPNVTLTGNNLFQGDSAGNAGNSPVCPGRDDIDVCGNATASVPTHFSVTAPAAATPGAPFIYTVTALDSNNNTAFAYAGAVHFTSSDPSAVLPSNSLLNHGVATFTATLNTTGVQSITATDVSNPTITGTSNPIGVGSGTAFSAVSVFPGAGSATTQFFTFNFTDPNGYQDLSVVNVLINNFLDGRQACYIAYVPAQNVLYLVGDDGGTLSQGLILTGAGSVSNSQCTVSGATPQAGGAFLPLALTITFNTGFGGNKVIYMAARSATQNTGWISLGSWNVPGGAVTNPTTAGVNPPRGSGLNPTMSFSFTDTKGYQDLGVVDILINNALDGRRACYFAYSRPLNTLYLVADDGATLLPGLTLNGAGSLTNSQCTLTTGAGPIAAFGNNLTLTLTISFAQSFGGNRIVYLSARDVTEANNSGWQPSGTWNIQ